MKIDFNVKEILTLPTNIMMAISLASGILLLSPISFLENLYMIDFREKNGFVIGIVFVISLSILIINLIYNILKGVSQFNKNRRFKEENLKKLNNLNDYQKTIVYGLYKEDSHTSPIPLNDVAVRELELYSIIGKAATQYYIHDVNNPFFPYHLQPWVIDELNSNDEMLSDFKNAFERKME